MKYVSFRVVGCGFTVAYMAFQRLSVVASCLGADVSLESTMFGFGLSLPSDCNAEEVRKVQAFL